MHVVSEDVDLELDDDAEDDGGLEPSEQGDDGDDGDDGRGDGGVDDDREDQPSSGALGQSSEADTAQRKHVSISYEKYTAIARMLIHHLRLHEETAQEDDEGLTMDQVIGWYTDTKEETIETEAQLEEEVKICRLVLNRMIHVDGVVLELSAALEEDDELGEGQERKILIVHPNYVDA